MEILLHTFERPNTRGGGYLPGDIITVQPDGHRWMPKELEDFAVIRVPDDLFDAAGWRALWTPQTETVSELEDEPDLPGARADEFRVRTLRKRRYHFDLDRLSTSVRDRIIRRTPNMPKAPEVLPQTKATWLIDKEVAAPRFDPDLPASGRSRGA